MSGQVNVLKVEAMKNVYEALMEHVVMHGIDVSVEKSKLVVQLYNKHAAISDLLKVNAQGTILNNATPQGGGGHYGREWVKISEFHRK